MQFHAIWSISAIFEPIPHVGYQKACTQAEKFIGGTSRGHWPAEGTKDPKKRQKASNNSPLQELHFLAQSAKYSSMFESPVKYVLGAKRPLFRGIKITLNLLQNSGRLFQPYGRQTQFCPRI